MHRSMKYIWFVMILLLVVYYGILLAKVTGNDAKISALICDFIYFNLIAIFL